MRLEQELCPFSFCTPSNPQSPQHSRNTSQTNPLILCRHLREPVIILTAAVLRATNGGLTQKWLLSQLWGQEYEIKVSQGQVPFGGSWGGSCPHLPAPGVPGIPGPVVWHSNLCFHLQVAFPYVSVPICVSYKDICHWIQGHPDNPG